MAAVAAVAAEQGQPLHPRAMAQFRAIAWLRWRLLINSLRSKGGAMELAARLLFYPFLAVLFAGPVVGAGFAGYSTIHERETALVFALMWAAFAVWFLVSAGSAMAAPAFDVALLLRFPMRFRSYVLLRFTLGLLSTPNVVGTLALAGAAVGMGIAEPRLFPWAVLVMACYALTMILLLRMVLIWLERWLAQRRTREIAGLLLGLFFLGFQFVNYRIQTMPEVQTHSGGRVVERLTTVWVYVEPALGGLPASLAARSIMLGARAKMVPAVGTLGGLLAYAALFAALFALRLRGEFQGESFNEAPARTAATGASAPGERIQNEREWRIPGATGAVMEGVRKELLYLKRTPSSLIGMLTPLVLVGLYAGRFGSSDMTLPCALAYAMFSTVPTLYNTLGQDAAGAQLYLLSPTPIRQVFVAKNIVSSGVIVGVAAIAAAIVVRTQRPPLPVALATALWFGFVLFTNLSLGNYRSIVAPKKIDPAKFSTRQQPSQLSVWMVIVVLMVSLLMGLAVIWVSRALGAIWAAPVVLLAFFVAAFGLYLRSLGRIEGVLLERRDELLAGLSKT